MPRPIRIQYPQACYHVMNRGRGRQVIFPDKNYFRAFLETLGEAHARFDAVIHAYCLMRNHYHLSIATPRANLDRIMRHINGVYTQRYNRLKQTDGPLFRGRYKAILVDEDAYLLQLSRYIHRNPAEVNGARPDSLLQYPWSSYLAYINQAKPESWLEREKIYRILGQKRRYAGYRAYIEAGLDEDTKRFYGKGNIAGILGGKDFRVSIANNEETLQVSGDLSQALSERPDAGAIVEAVSRVFGVGESVITERRHGRQAANLPRKVALYCSQHWGDLSLKDIAYFYGLSHGGSVSGAVSTVRKRLAKGELESEFKAIRKILNITK